MRRVSRAIEWSSRALAYLAAVCSVAIMVVLLVDLGYRNLRGGSLVGAYEVVIMLMLCVVFLGLPYAEVSGTSVRVTLVTDRMGPRTATTIRFASTVFAAVIAVWLASASWTGFSGALASNDYMAGLINFPTWPMRLAIAVGVTALAVVLTAKVVERAGVMMSEFRGRGGARSGVDARTGEPNDNSTRDDAESSS